MISATEGLALFKMWLVIFGISALALALSIAGIILFVNAARQAFS